MAELTHRGSIEIARSPSQVWDLVSDVTRTGEWSPQCKACEWDDGDGPWVGAHFTGHNVDPDREWSTRSEVIAAERGREFGWAVNGGWVHWLYTMEPSEQGTRLTESWDFREAGQAGFRERYRERAQSQIERRTRAAHDGIPVTLAAIKRVAESSQPVE